MRVACSSEPEGRVYRFYRTSEQFSSALKPVVPYLMACAAEVIVGSEPGDPRLLLRVGPVSGNEEATLLGLIGQRLTTPCEPLEA